MKASEIKKVALCGGLNKYSHIYSNVEQQAERIARLVDGFIDSYGDKEACLLSVPGRSEILGNHTDHNNGCVLAGAIDRDVMAIAARNDSGAVRLHSVGYEPSHVDICKCCDPENFTCYTSDSLIGGMVDGFVKNGYTVGGFDAYSDSEVLKGSGISSSAAYEVMIGNILNHLYNGGAVDNKEIAKLAQYSENRFFGKPSGLMDQMACAVGGFVYIDFEDNKNPEVRPIDFSLTDEGYALAIVNTGGNHADLNDDYASVPAEMKAVAAVFGKNTLRGLTEDDIFSRAKELRESVGDRAILRALHFVRENQRVCEAKEALTSGDVKAFLNTVTASGASSFKYLQNVYTNINVKEQGLSLALAIADGYLSDKSGAHRVHGGGFAGTVQVFLKREDLQGLVERMNAVFGEGSVMPLGIRPLGAIKIDFE